MKFTLSEHPGICTLMLAVCFFVCVSKCFGAENSPKNDAQYWIVKYGLADPEKPEIRKAHAIFEKVRNAADNRKNRIPKLKIVSSPDDPWAVALPDGNVILSAGALKKCYQNVSESEGDARLAFVLGHELGHMAEDHFRHLAALSGNPGAEESALEKEMQADDQGFLYASLAGFQTDTLVGQEKGKQDFFTAWTAQMPHQHTDPAHPRPEERAALLRDRLKILSDKVHLFHVGVRLAHFGKYADALWFLEGFQEIFPSREVLNNLGYCYLQKAIDKMPTSLTYEFWLPLVIDVRTRAENIVRGNSRSAKEQGLGKALPLLEEAAEYLRQACDADKTYLPSRINLAVTYFWLGQTYKARAVIEEAFAISPADADVCMLRALIMLEEAPDTDMLPHAEKIITELTQNPASRTPGLYNLAVLYEKRGRSRAAELWMELAKDAHLPAPFHAELKKRIPVPDLALTPRIISLPPLPVQVGTDLIQNQTARKLLDTWEKLPVKGRDAAVYRNSKGIWVLEFNGFAEMVVISGQALAETDPNAFRCEHPLSETKTAEGTLCACESGITILRQDGKIREIWIARNNKRTLN